MNNKINKLKLRRKENMLRKAPLAVVACILVIGLGTFIGALAFNPNDLFDSSGSEAAMNAVVFEENKRLDGTLTAIPRFVEKSVFESLIALIPEDILVSDNNNTSVKDRFRAYYHTLKTLGNGEFYLFDPSASEREIREILGYWNEYIGWDDADYIAMLAKYQIYRYISENGK